MVEMDSPRVKAVLFDMDGTLLDTESLSDKAALLAFGGSLPKEILQKPPMSKSQLPWELKKQILGKRGDQWSLIALSYAKDHWGISNENDDKDKLPPTPSQFWRNWEDSLNSMCEEIEACPGALELVDAFSKTGMPMAIATSSRYSGVAKKRVRHEKIFRHLQAIVAGDDEAVTCGKPAPDIYLEAAKRLNVHPKECLVFEDALSGVRSGKAAGCYVVAIPDPRFSAEDRKIVSTRIGHGSQQPLGLHWNDIWNRYRYERV